MSKVVSLGELVLLANASGASESLISAGTDLIENGAQLLAEAVAKNMDIEISFGPDLDSDGLYVHFTSDKEEKPEAFEEYGIDPTGEW